MRSTPPLLLRRAGPADVDALAAVQRRSSLRAYAAIFPPSAPAPTLEQLRQGWAAAMAAPGAVAFAAAGADGTVAGGVVARLDPGGDGVGEVARLYVDPHRWRGGAGAALLDAAVAHLVGRGATQVGLWVLEGNTVARAMYERRGWRLDPGPRTEWPALGVAEVRYRLDPAGRE